MLGILIAILVCLYLIGATIVTYEIRPASSVEGTLTLFLWPIVALDRIFRGASTFGGEKEE